MKFYLFWHPVTFNRSPLEWVPYHTVSQQTLLSLCFFRLPRRSCWVRILKVYWSTSVWICQRNTVLRRVLKNSWHLPCQLRSVCGYLQPEIIRDFPLCHEREAKIFLARVTDCAHWCEWCACNGYPCYPISPWQPRSACCMPRYYWWEVSKYLVSVCNQCVQHEMF